MDLCKAFLVTIQDIGINLKNRKYKVGIAGFGVVGKRRFQILRKKRNIHIISICDKTFNFKTKTKNNVQYFNNFSDLIIKTDIDILFVCLTNDVAPLATMMALNNGIHVFCEKPPGRNVKDIKKVIRVENKKRNLKLMYGFNHRYHDSVIEALKIVNEKKLGKIINIKGVYGKSQMINFNSTDWRTKRKIAGGGILLDQGIHIVDLIRLFAGEFIVMSSIVSNNFWNYDVEDNAYALIKSSSGVVGMIHSSATQWRHKFSLDINLEKGSINLSGILSGSKSYGEETLTLIKSNPVKDKGIPKEKIFSYKKDSSWEREIDSFMHSIIYDKDVKNGNSNDALATMKLVENIYKSDKEWKKKL